MNVEEVFDLLPLSEKTLRKRISKRLLPFILHNDGKYASEYHYRPKEKENRGMIKYYKGRKLSCYSVKDTIG